MTCVTWQEFKFNMRCKHFSTARSKMFVVQIKVCSWDWLFQLNFCTGTHVMNCLCNVVFVPGIPLGKIILNKFSGSSSIFGIFGSSAAKCWCCHSTTATNMTKTVHSWEWRKPAPFLSPCALWSKFNQSFIFYAVRKHRENLK